MFARALTVLSLVCSPAFASDFWVDQATGDDANTGASPAEAWRTITFALSQTGAGDTVRVQPGFYDVALGETFPLVIGSQVVRSELGPEFTILRGPGFGEGVLIDPDAPASSFGGFTMNNFVTHVRVDDFGASPMDVTLEDLRMSMGDVGLTSTSSNGATFPQPNRLTVRRVLFNGADVGALLDHSPSTDLDLHFDNVIALGCDTGVQVDVGVGSASQQVFERCLFTLNSQTGLALATTAGSQGTIAHSVIASNGSGLVTTGTGTLDVVHCTVVNNAGVGVGSTGDIRRSVLWGNGDDLDCVGCSVEYSNIEDGDFSGVSMNISADPLFRAPAAGDYRLMFGSPCIDTIDLAPLPGGDLFAIARGNDGDLDTIGRSDMGAHEFATLVLAGQKSIGTTARLEITGPNGSSARVIAFRGMPTPPIGTFFGLLHVPHGQTFTLGDVPTTGAMPALVNLPIPNNPLLIGLTVTFQTLITTPSAPFGFALSDAAVLTVLP